MQASTAIYRHSEGAALSILVSADYRQSGIGCRLTEDVFRALPQGVTVEAWVAACNQVSLRAVPALGFERSRILTDQGRAVHVFVRSS